MKFKMDYRGKFAEYSEIAEDFLREYSVYITAISVAVAIVAGVAAYMANKNLERGIEKYNSCRVELKSKKSELKIAKESLEACVIDN